MPGLRRIGRAFSLSPVAEPAARALDPAKDRGRQRVRGGSTM